MSSFIPIVSSSPPPLDTGGDDDWDDDFGNFMGADNTSFSTSVEYGTNKLEDHVTSHKSSQFADFGKFPDDKGSSINNENKTIDFSNFHNNCNELDLKVIENGLDNNVLSNSDSGMGFSSPPFKLDIPVKEISNADSGNVMNQSLTVDSGLCSSDNSPLSKSEPVSGSENFQDKSEKIEDFHYDETGSLPEVKNNHPDSNDCVVSSTTSAGLLNETMAAANQVTENQSDLPQSADNDTDKPSTYLETKSEIISAKLPSQEASVIELNRTCSDSSDEVKVKVDYPVSVSALSESNEHDEVCDSNVSVRKPDSICEPHVGECSSDNDQGIENLNSGEYPKDAGSEGLQNELGMKTECGSVGQIEANFISEARDACDIEIDSKITKEASEDASSTNQSDMKNKDSNMDSLESETEISEPPVQEVQSNCDDFDDFADFSSAPVSDNFDVKHSENLTSNCSSVVQSIPDSEVQISEKEDAMLQNRDDDSSQLHTPVSLPDSKSGDDTVKNSVSTASFDGSDLQDKNFVDCKESEIRKVEDESSGSKTKNNGMDLTEEEDDFADFSSAPDSGGSKEYSCGKSENNMNTEKGDSEGKQDTENLSEEDDFADFSSAPFSDKNDENSFGKSEDNVNDERGDSLGKQKTKNLSEEEEDDFADFSSAPSDVIKATEKSQESSSWDQFATFSEAPADSGGDNWAAFAEPAVCNTVVGGSEEDDFEDFEDFQEVPSVTSSNKLSRGAVFDEAVSKSFPTSMTIEVTDEGALLMNDDMVAESPKTEHLWCRLKKQDRGTSVLKWTKAKSYKSLFSSLKIDTRNILIGHKKQSVPIYAANLTLGGVLEPTKGPVKSTKEEIEEPTLVDTNKQEEKPSDLVSNRSISTVGPKPSLAINPVSFDWSSAGLNNPLESSNKNFDLDFLVVAETEVAAKNGVMESEMLHGHKSTLQPLENILANLKNTTSVKRGYHTENLGDETKRILSTIPDLSFMHTKVLMFPLRHQNDP